MIESFPTRRAPLFALLALTFAVAACGDDTNDRPDWSDPTRIDFAAGLDIDLDAMDLSDTGLYTQDLEVGEGPDVVVSDTVDIQYNLWLPDGQLIEANRATFPSGSGQTAIPPLDELIAAWRQGVPGMQAGGLRRLVVPPALGYGNLSLGGIPANSTLIFEIRVLEILTAADAG